MDPTTHGSLRDGFLADCKRIHREWDTRVRSLDTDGLISLYAQDATLETPLVLAIFEGSSGILRGHREIRPFFEEGARRRPNELVRWYRTDNWFTDGKRVLVWELSPGSARRRTNRAHGSHGNRAWSDPTSSNLLGLVRRQPAHAERGAQGDLSVGFRCHFTEAKAIRFVVPRESGIGRYCCISRKSIFSRLYCCKAS
jgi:hypothetical protein